MRWVDRAFNLDHQVRQALRELRKGVESLKSDATVYKVHLCAMEEVTDLDESSPYKYALRLTVRDGFALKLTCSQN